MKVIPSGIALIFTGDLQNTSSPDSPSWVFWKRTITSQMTHGCAAASHNWGLLVQKSPSAVPVSLLSEGDSHCFHCQARESF